MSNQKQTHSLVTGKNIEITTNIGCINMCSYCPQELLIKSYAKISAIKYMTLETFKYCISKINSDMTINFTGFSEPFLNKDCMEMIKLASSLNYKLLISTTLVGFNIKDKEELENIKFERFDVHLPSEKGENIPKSSRHIELIKSINIPNIKYHYHGDKLYHKFNFLKVRHVLTHSRAGNVEKINDINIKGPVICKRNFNYPVLLPNGDLVICCMDYGLKHIIGNLFEQTMEEIYNGDKFKYFYNLTRQNTGSMCHKCGAFARKGI